MRKYIHIISLAIVLSMGMCTDMLAAEYAEMSDIENRPAVETAISVEGQSVHVVGANGQVLDVYNIVGVKIASVKVEGMDKRLDLNLQKGCYILKIGKVVRKVSVK